MFFTILQNRCEEKNIKITPLLIELNLSKGNISKWKKGSLPNGEILIKLANRLDCSIDYLLGRTNVPEVNHDEVIMPPKIMLCRDNEVELKFVGTAAEGLPLELIVSAPKRLHIDSISTNVHVYPTDIVVKIKGDSMIEAAIHDGDYAIIRPCPIAENGQIALVEVDNDCSLKRFYLKSDSVELHPCNKSLPIQRYKLFDGIRIIGTYVCTCTGTLID